VHAYKYGKLFIRKHVYVFTFSENSTTNIAKAQERGC